MSNIRFAAREELSEYEWDNQRKDWKRPSIDPEVLKRLSERSTLNGLARIAYFMLLLTAAAVATVYVGRISIWLAIPVLYFYYFIYGFWVAIEHELEHKTVFGKDADGFSNIFFFFVQTLMWDSMTYARTSHKLHHRYTMVRGVDPETDWPEVITTPWLRMFLLNLVLRILVVGALVELYKSVRRQIERVGGKMSPMVRVHCSEKDIAAIRLESAAILLFHAMVVASAVIFHVWELLVFITIAWQIGNAIETLWHATKHIGRPYNVNDHRLNTRSIHVSWFINLMFWGLDDHVEHHLYPVVPSRNLPKLRRILEKDLPDPDNIFGCWAEMFDISREKDRDPKREFVSVKRAPAATRALEKQAADAL